MNQPRQQPHDDGAEKALLCSCLLNAEGVGIVQEILSHEDFYRQAHADIWRVLCRMTADGRAVDHLTVTDALRTDGLLERVGGSSYLAELLCELASPVNPKRYAEIVVEKAHARRLIRSVISAAERAYAGESPREIAEEVDRVLFGLLCQQSGSRWRSSVELMTETLGYIQRVSTQGQLVGIGTGLRDLDGCIGGWQRTDLVLVGGRPSMGKTAFALQAMLAAARQGKVAAIFSLEMGFLQIGLRFLSIGAGLDVSRLRMGEVSTADDWRALSVAGQQIADGAIYVDDTSSLTHETIRAKARQLKIQHGLDVLFVDYLQLVEQPKGTTRADGLGQISRALKLLAKELDITVVALSQLNRSLESRDDKRPLLSDLRESGSLEQDADVVLFLYRDEVYNSESQQAGMAEILVRKQRNGPIGSAHVAFVKRQALFADLAEYQEPVGYE